MTAPVLFETNADCLDVILNRPDEDNLITNEMGQEIARVLTRSDTKDHLYCIGVEPVASSPQEAAATIKSEMNKWGKLIKDLGITNN